LVVEWVSDIVAINEPYLGATNLASITNIPNILNSIRYQVSSKTILDNNGLLFLHYVYY